MGRGVFMVAVAVFLHVGVSGWRHDGAVTHRKHSNRATNIGRLLPELQNNTVVVAQVGGTATIKCYTVFLGDEMVTWMKRDEDQLLAVGTQVYSSDARYSVAHLRHDKLWEFSVRAVRKADAGLYECQLTTHPPTALFFTLKVVEARAVLGGGAEVHVHTGGRVRLRCTVEYATEPPAYVFWFHNHTMINYSPRRPLRVLHHHLGSSLVITNVTWEDAGTYTCEPHLAEPANLTLHVVEGEKHAALHNGQNDGAEQEVTAAAASSSSAGHSSHNPSTFLLIGYCCLLKMLSLFHHPACETVNTDSSSWL